MPLGDGTTLEYNLNRKALTTGLTGVAAANVWAGTTNLELVDALNVRAANPLGSYRELAGVLNQLAGTANLEVEAAGQSL